MNKPLEEFVHPIHDQTIYLNVEHKKEAERGISSRAMDI